MHLEIDYYKAFDLIREPFSSSPDPDFLYQSRQHFGTLQHLENAIRSETGMNLVLGASGTGKTTLFRHLFRKLSHEKKISPFTLSVKPYEDITQFEEDVMAAFGVSESSASTFETPQEMVCRFLLKQVQGNSQTVALLIDDAHLIPEYCYDVLKKLTEYELNGKKLVQLVIFADMNFLERLSGAITLESHVKVYRTLGPLNFTETRNMISYRLKVAGNTIKQTPLFTYPGIVAIYLATGGYPRKIVDLCHRCIVSMIVRNSMRSGWFHVRANARRILSGSRLLPEYIVSAGLITAMVFSLLVMTGVFESSEVKKSVSRSGHETPLSLSEGEGSDETAPGIVLSDTSDLQETISETSESETVKPEIVTTVTETESVSVMSENHEKLLTPPELMGSVGVKRGDTLLVMLEKVYGHSRSRYRSPVIEVNGHIRNINALEIGDEIFFPPIKASIDETLWANDVYWIRIISKDTLNDAVEFLRQWSPDLPKIKLIPYFDKKEGLKFDVVIRKVFRDAASAENSLDRLQQTGNINGGVIRFSRENVDYYANPMFR